MLTQNQSIQFALKSPWPPRIVSAIIMALIAWWGFVNILPLFEEEKVIVASTPVSTQIKTTPKKSLSKLDLFGASEKKATANKTSEAKLTKLNFTLRGILATDDPKQGIAQIQNAQKEEKHFAVNDTVFGKATLEEIHADHVILLHNGRYETLKLPEEFLNLKHFSVQLQKLERKKTATNFRNIFLNGDGEVLTKLFGFDTVWKNSSFVGFVIKALGPKGIEMMKILGVKDGDIIVVVNGLRLSESLEAAERLKDIKDATSVDVIIDRNGEEIPFHFEFNTPITDIVDVGNTGNNSPNIANGNTKDLSAPQPSASKSYKNKTTEDGKVDRSGFTQSLIDSRDDDEDLEADWGESSEAEEYRLEQVERRTGVAAPVEMDH